MRRNALGKGLNALIPNIDLKELEKNGLRMQEIPVAEISPNRFQPRKTFNDEQIIELADSIEEKGIIQPIIVTQNTTGFELVAGERRLRAVKKLNYKKILAIIKDIPESQLLEIALIENIQRENLNPLEEAYAYQQLIEKYRYTQEEAAKSVGKDRSSVTNYLRLLKLPHTVKELIRDREISMGHARALLGIDSVKLQEDVGAIIKSKKLSVRQTEQIVSNIKKEEKESPSPVESKDNVKKDVEKKLQKVLGTKVVIKIGKKGGKIEISYSSESEFKRLYNFLDRL